jgi:hypothetical protein
MTRIRQEGFSAPISIELFVDGEPVEVAQVGPNTIRLRQPMPGIQGKAAKLVITIGSTRKKQDIILSQCSPTDPSEVSYW